MSKFDGMFPHEMRALLVHVEELAEAVAKEQVFSFAEHGDDCHLHEIGCFAEAILDSFPPPQPELDER